MAESGLRLLLLLLVLPPPPHCCMMPTTPQQKQRIHWTCLTVAAAAECSHLVKCDKLSPEAETGSKSSRSIFSHFVQETTKNTSILWN
jgi:hypothetical protein